MSKTETKKVAKLIEDSLKPESGWWKSDTGKTVVICATRMLLAGISVEDTEDILRDLISATRSEYGE